MTTELAGEQVRVAGGDDRTCSLIVLVKEQLRWTRSVLQTKTMGTDGADGKKRDDDAPRSQAHLRLGRRRAPSEESDDDVVSSRRDVETPTAAVAVVDVAKVHAVVDNRERERHGLGSSLEIGHVVSPFNRDFARAGLRGCGHPNLLIERRESLIALPAILERHLIPIGASRLQGKLRMMRVDVMDLRRTGTHAVSPVAARRDHDTAT